MGLPEERRETPSPIARQVLSQCAQSCERALIDYATQVAGVGGSALLGYLLRAIAVVRTTLDLLDLEDSRRELALRLTVEACSAAAAHCRRAGLDEPLLRCAVACERAADEAELVLTSLGH